MKFSELYLYVGWSHSYIHKVISLRSFTKPAYYAFMVTVHNRVTFPHNDSVRWDIYPIGTPVYLTMSEDMRVFCLELCPCCFHDVNIWFESTARKICLQWPKQAVVTWGQNGTLWWVTFQEIVLCSGAWTSEGSFVSAYRAYSVSINISYVYVKFSILYERDCSQFTIYACY
jgi:hypothetical protein